MASRAGIVKRADTDLLSVDHVLFSGQKPVAQILETTPVTSCRRFPSSLQILADSEIFRLRFIRLYPNAEEVLETSNFPAPLPVWVWKKRESLCGLSGFVCLFDIGEFSQTGVVTFLRVHSVKAGP